MSNSKQGHTTTPSIIVHYHASKMQQTDLESAAAIASKSGRRGLMADAHQKLAPAGANAKTKQTRAVGRLIYPVALGLDSKKIASIGGLGRTPVAPINKWLGSILAEPSLACGEVREVASGEAR